MEINAFFQAQMELKLLEIRAAADGLSERLIKSVIIPKSLSPLMKNMPGTGTCRRETRCTEQGH